MFRISVAFDRGITELPDKILISLSSDFTLGSTMRPLIKKKDVSSGDKSNFDEINSSIFF